MFLKNSSKSNIIDVTMSFENKNRQIKWLFTLVMKNTK